MDRPPDIAALIRATLAQDERQRQRSKACALKLADAAQVVLQQRIRNLPSNRVFEVGWLRRVATYRRPIADPESPERALRKSLRVTAAR